MRVILRRTECGALVEWQWQGKVENLSKCNFIHHIYDTDWCRIQSGRSKCRADVAVWISCNYHITWSSYCTENISVSITDCRRLGMAVEQSANITIQRPATYTPHIHISQSAIITIPHTQLQYCSCRLSHTKFTNLCPALNQQNSARTPRQLSIAQALYNFWCSKLKCQMLWFLCPVPLLSLCRLQTAFEM